MRSNKKAAIFDLDGVLVNSMPLHFKAWRSAFQEVAGISVTERDLYLLEGMRGAELIQKIFEQNHVNSEPLAHKVNEEKNKIFGTIKDGIKPFPGTREAVEAIPCKKAVVSGSAKRDVIPIVEQAFGKQFEVILTADDTKKGKPDPSSFLEAHRRLGIQGLEQSIIIENAPLGVKAANNAGIDCIVVLNNTPLLRSDFDGLISPEKILDSTALIKDVLGDTCL